MSEKNIDPVCGMEVGPEEAVCTYEYKGKKYYFCAESCRDHFKGSPDEYLSGSEPGPGQH